MRTHRRRPVVLGVAAALGLSLLMLPAAPAQAGSNGRKNTTIVAGAIAAHQLLTGKTVNGLIAGAGAVYAYTRYRDAKKEEEREERLWNRYGRNRSGFRDSRSVGKVLGGRIDRRDRR